MKKTMGWFYPSEESHSRYLEVKIFKGLYFISFAVVGWLDVFIRNEYKEIFLESLRFCQKSKGMEIHAWCIMSSYVHLVFRSINGQKPELLIGDLKRFTSKALVSAIKENPTEKQNRFFIRFFP
ncbi:transposase [Chryseobacterium jejuense]|uniref:transposase n=1 Tax=Chryseobacterium jejuense TaxID=445960 RepID=UPI00293D415E|nr:transposase [Chryseobacterium jejuense]